MILDNGLKLIKLGQEFTQYNNNIWTETGFTDYNGTSNAQLFLCKIYPYSSPKTVVLGWQMARNQAIAEWISECASFLGICNGTTYYFGSASDTTWKNGGLILGDGDVAPDLSDYKLSGNMITDFSATSSLSGLIVDGKYEFTSIYSITNTGASTITIKEIGMSKPNSGNDGRILLSRSVLDAPIVINPGNIGTLIYKGELY